MSLLQRDRELAAPGDGEKKSSAFGVRCSEMFKEFGDVVEEAAKAGGVPARRLVATRAASVQKGDIEAGAGQALAGILIPAGVALDAVDADDLRPECLRDGIMAIVTAVA